MRIYFFPERRTRTLFASRKVDLFFDRADISFVFLGTVFDSLRALHHEPQVEEEEVRVEELHEKSDVFTAKKHTCVSQKRKLARSLPVYLFTRL